MNPQPVNSAVPAKIDPVSNDEDAKLKEACQEFESIMLKQMVSSLRSTSFKSDLFGESKEGELFNHLFDERIAEALSQQEGIGLANLLFQQLAGKNLDESGAAP